MKALVLGVLCLAAAALLSPHVSSMPQITAEYAGCVDGGAYWQHEMVERIIIWDGDNLTYLERHPCGSGGTWIERHNIVAGGPSGSGIAGGLNANGELVFAGVPGSASGLITAGTGLCCRVHNAASTSELVVSSDVTESLFGN